MAFQAYRTDHDMIEGAFTFHPATTQEVMIAHESVRDACKFAAHELANVCVRSPELTLAIRSLQEAMMFANSSIAQWGVRAENSTMKGER